MKHKCYTLEFMQKVYFMKSLLKMDYPNNKRTAVYQEHIPPVIGMIIGNKIFYEGDYKHPTKDSWTGDWDCPGELNNRKAIKFYVVATGFNITYYVPIAGALPF